MSLMASLVMFALTALSRIRITTCKSESVQPGDFKMH